MAKRPIVILGAAFLLTVAAALFAPNILILITLPLAVLLVVTTACHRSITAVAVGCLLAIACCGFFVVRVSSARSLVGSTLELRGVLLQNYYQQQRLLAELPDGSQVVVQLSPAIEGIETGECYTVVVEVAQMEYSSFIRAGDNGVLLIAEPQSWSPLPAGSLQVPAAVHGELLRQHLSTTMQQLNPAPATGVTSGILFALLSNIAPQVRNDFSLSGMAHLLAVSGLHLSILAGLARGLVRRLGGGKLLQCVAVVASSLLMFFATGMSISAFRAAIMVILGLGGELLHRRSDGITSVTVAAVVIVALCPPVITELSFQLSFLSVVGILTLAPRLRFGLVTLWVRYRGSCGAFASAVIAAFAVSFAAQLATLPVVAWHFGSVPLVGVLVNLVAIPLIYPVMAFGLLSSVAIVCGFTGAATVLLTLANFFSMLLARLAYYAARLPFGSINASFPLELVLLLGIAVATTLAILLPIGYRTKQRLTVAIAAVAIATAIASSYLMRHSVRVVSATATGSTLVVTPAVTLVVDSREGNQPLSLDYQLLAQLGYSGEPIVLVAPYPNDSAARIARSAEQSRIAPDSVYTVAPIDGYNRLGTAAVSLHGGVLLSSPSPYLTQIEIGDTKLMKFSASYDTIVKYGGEQPDGDVVLIDYRGNLLSLGGSHAILRHSRGKSYLRIPL